MEKIRIGDKHPGSLTLLSANGNRNWIVVELILNIFITVREMSVCPRVYRPIKGPKTIAEFFVGRPFSGFLLTAEII